MGVTVTHPVEPMVGEQLPTFRGHASLLQPPFIVLLEERCANGACTPEPLDCPGRRHAARFRRCAAPRSVAREHVRNEAIHLLLLSFSKSSVVAPPCPRRSLSLASLGSTAPACIRSSGRDRFLPRNLRRTRSAHCRVSRRGELLDLVPGWFQPMYSTRNLRQEVRVIGARACSSVAHSSRPLLHLDGSSRE